MTDSFLRQRRNLIVVNLVILLLATADVKIDKLAVASIEFSAFGEPTVLLAFLWLAWAYFLYRYVVYFVKEAPERIAKYWKRDFENVVGIWIKRKVYQEHEEPNDGAGYSYWALRRRGWIYSGQAHRILPKGSGSESEREFYNFERPFSRIEVLPWEVLALGRFLLLSPAITDYIFALALSMGVLLYCGIFGTWEGNLVTLFV